MSSSDVFCWCRRSFDEMSAGIILELVDGQRQLFDVEQKLSMELEGQNLLIFWKFDKQ